MKAFDHVTAASTREAVELLSSAAPDGARLIAGGTDLLTLMKADLIAPPRLIDLKPASELRYLRFDDAGALHIGALTTLADLERHPEVAQRLPVLPQSVRDAATPQLRALATVGGNLLQRPRCWYYRGDALCWLKGGSACFARDGQNKYHAILDHSPCVAVHPSDLAPALLALDAELVIHGPGGARVLPVESFFAAPTDQERVEYRLAADEVLAEITVPRQPEGARGAYLKVMDRQAWAFALVSAAAQVALRDGRIEHVRLVLGGVANVPQRIRAVEDLLTGQELTPKLAEQAAERAVAGAKPLAHNAYKVPLARELARRALLAATGLMV
ncbi:MAG: Periplasmic aromatic aldehyde oxidoreductase, FAD binding subunit YagS [Ktedonobacterales bacterium]|jgi:xanthine dehydrogenase YagS FAD-binding subunit|nr:MAG: Periplasmic aromatic aldehyde oxidoreductase, FAD binding subunit YagS [Ktedonobacterales bacterium]